MSTLDHVAKEVEAFYGVLPDGIISAMHLYQGLQVLVDTQFTVSSHVPGAMPPDGFPAGKDAVRTYSLAMVSEVMELANELGWKPWKLDQPDAHLPNRPAPAPHDHSVEAGEYVQALAHRTRILDEFADILAFLGILATYVQRATGAGMEEIAAQYARKSTVNMQRIAGQVAGYGVTPGEAERTRDRQRLGEAE